MNVAEICFPRSLADWRSQAEAWGKATQSRNGKYEPYDLWRPLIPFFKSRGLTLWETTASYTTMYYVRAPKGTERAPDGFSYLSEYFPANGPPPLHDYIQQIVRGYVHFRVILQHRVSSSLRFSCNIICRLRILLSVRRAHWMVAMS